MSNDTTPNFRKEGAARVADLPAMRSLEVELEFEQKKGGGLRALRNKFTPADPDLVAGVCVGPMVVDQADPKNRQSIINGAVVHRGDAKGNGSEVVAVDVTRMLDYDSDIDGIVLGGICPGDEGFSRVAGVVVRLYDTSNGARTHLGNVRFDVDSRRSAVVIATIKKSGDGWQVRNEPTYGYAESIGSMFRQAMAR